MGETLKDRKELFEFFNEWTPQQPDVIIKIIESLGLRIVPETATKAMERAYLTSAQLRGELAGNLRAAIAASPFAPENPNG